MVPIYDTDIAEERFEQDRWRNYELADRVEARTRRKRRLWIGAAVAVFVALSALPPVSERLPKWASLKAARALSQRVDRLKIEAAHERQAIRLKLVPGSGLKFTVARQKTCADKGGAAETQEALPNPDLRWVTPIDAQLKIPGLASEICFDPLKGFFVDGKFNSADQKLAGMGVIPVEDLTEARIDRVSIVFFGGENGAMSFE